MNGDPSRIGIGNIRIMAVMNIVISLFCAVMLMMSAFKTGYRSWDTAGELAMSALEAVISLVIVFVPLRFIFAYCLWTWLTLRSSAAKHYFQVKER